MEDSDRLVPTRPAPSSLPKKNANVPQKTEEPTSKADILVAGSVAVDLNCNFHNDRYPDPKPVSPISHTSNTAGITQSIGGVGHNVALAAQSVHRGLDVKLCSMIGTDM